MEERARYVFLRLPVERRNTAIRVGPRGGGEVRWGVGGSRRGGERE